MSQKQRRPSTVSLCNVLHLSLSVQVYCHLEGSGCPWTGKLCDVDSHLATDCPRVLMECTNGCGDVMHRQELPDHLQHLCYLRLVNCEHCGIEGPFKMISDEHYNTCPKVPLSCPNQCSPAKILREDLAGHLEECPLEVIVCGFQSLGCKDAVARRDLESHMSSHQTRHLLLAVERIASMSRLLETCQAGMEQLREELEESQREQESLRLLVQAQQQQGPSSLSLAQAQRIQTRRLLMEKHLEASVERCALDPFLPVVIKMDDYNYHSGRPEPWYSQPFYSAPLCYKLCLCVYASGACSGKFTHLSVYVHLMAGEFDDNLFWPLEMKLTVELQNQLVDDSHWVVDCDLSRSTPQRIRRRVNQGRAKKGAGSAKFIPLDKLRHNAAFHNCQYLRNNKLFFSVY